MRPILYSVIFVAMAASAAYAQQPARTIDMTTVITDMHGKPVPDGSQVSKDDPQCEKCTPLTLGSVVATALLADRKDEQGLSAVDKAKRGMLAMKIMDDKAAALTAAQSTEIVKLLNIWPPLIVARALPLIDPVAAATDTAK